MCIGFLFLGTDLEPLLTRHLVKVFGRDLGAGLELARTAGGSLAHQHFAHALIQIILEDAQLVGEVLADPFDFRLLDRQGTRVLLDAIAREHAHVDHGAVHARGHAQTGVLHIGGLLAEDRAQQLLFRGQLGLTLRGDLADQDVSGLDLGADEGDTGFIEFGQRRVAHIRNIGGDFLGSEFRVASHAGQLFDMDRRETILLHDALGDEDRILEVVAVPGHERDQHVLAQRQLT